MRALPPDARSGEPAPLLFPWRRPSIRIFSTLVPIVLAALTFVFLLEFVRVKVAAPQFKMAAKASWIHLPAAGDGLSWAQRAKEGGPRLARYEPAEWEAYAPLAAEVMQATRIPPHPYSPVLRALPPDAQPQPQALADKGEAVLPHRTPLAAEPHTAGTCRLAPVLYPLSAVGTSALPQDLPAFAGKVDAAMAATEWRFLLRLYPTGGVADTVSLTKAAGTTVSLLENWLRGVRFDPKLAAQGGWLAVGIQFTNQPIHGTDPR